MNILQKRDFFNGLASQWDHLPAPPDAPAKIAEFTRRAIPETSRRVLDLGCGTGIILSHAARQGRQIVELDLAEDMLRENRRKSGGQGLHVCADAAQLPFAPGLFDAIVCFNVLPHIADLGALLDGLARAVMMGGTVTIGHLMGSAQLNEFHGQLGPAVCNDKLPCSSELAQRLVAAGLDLLSVEERPDWYFIQCRRTLDEQ